jgi:aurora kinase A-interacting protein
LSSRCLSNYSRTTATQQSVFAASLPQFDRKETESLFKSHTNTIPLSIRNRNKEIRDFPIHNKIIENPRISILHEINDILNNTHIIEMPTSTSNDVGENGIQAARLIVIRKRKMRKHKLKKLRKKMKFEWAKVRQRREMRKEKAFQAVLIGQIKEAEKFSAEKYVAEKIQKSIETPIPKLWRGRRLPEFIIKEKLGIK